jgi:L-histidine N-alpha-methyltransferase
MQLTKRAELNRDRLKILNCLIDNDRQADADAIRRGLTGTPKRLPCKYFYDVLGSRLFEEICLLPEYYLTRTEIALLAREAPAIMAFFANAAGDLVELGSGSNQKIKLLLQGTGAFSNHLRYVPVDISPSALLESARELLYLYEDLPILGIIGDFTRHLEILPPGRKLITFLGSTIGNFSDQERLVFLKNIAGAMNPADRFLLGLDLVKPVEVIEAAYNDSRGVTAAFNQNILSHINQAWDGDFNPADFRHVARFDPAKERMEMYLQATRPVQAHLTALDLPVVCRSGEAILTETCQKFTPVKARHDFQAAGLAVDQWFSDDQNWFSLVLLKKGTIS